MNAALSPDPSTSAADRSTTSTMSALVARRYGGPEVLDAASIPVPTAGSGEVLVRVAAAGVSRAAMHLLIGEPYLLRLAGFGLRAPKQPAVGIEAAGVVAAVGPDVTGFAPGDEVFGYVSGACAEWAVAKAAKLAHKPTELSFAEAAALVDSASTAFQGVRDHAGVCAGQRVLVLGGSGGVGSFAVQVAADLGAEVTATARTSKLEFVRSLGAAHVVDHTTTDPLDVDRPFDVIVDVGGNRPIRRLRKALAADGTLVIVGGEAGGKVTGGFERQLLAPLRAIGSRQSLKTFVANENAGTLDELAALAVAGRLRAAVDRTHPLVEGAEAFRRMAAGQICGKDVIEVRGR